MMDYVNLQAPWAWSEHPCPRCFGDRNRQLADITGIQTGGNTVARQPGESVDELARRVAELHGTAAAFTLQYAP